MIPVKSSFSHWLDLGLTLSKSLSTACISYFASVIHVLVMLLVYADRHHTVTDMNDTFITIALLCCGELLCNIWLLTIFSVIQLLILDKQQVALVMHLEGIMKFWCNALVLFVFYTLDLATVSILLVKAIWALVPELLQFLPVWELPSAHCYKRWFQNVIGLHISPWTHSVTKAEQ